MGLIELITPYIGLILIGGQLAFLVYLIIKRVVSLMRIKNDE